MKGRVIDPKGTIGKRTSTGIVIVAAVLLAGLLSEPVSAAEQPEDVIQDMITDLSSAQIWTEESTEMSSAQIWTEESTEVSPAQIGTEESTEVSPAQIGTDGASETVLAEKVSFSDIKAGDEIVIISDSLGTAVSLKASGTRLGQTSPGMGKTAGGRSVIVSMSSDTAVFTVSDAGDGSIYLRCSEGYLSTTESGGSLFYAGEAGELCKWLIEDGGLLRSTNAHYGTKYNQYLELYNSYFTVYGKNDSSVMKAFTFSFYRVGDTKPEDKIPDVYRLPVFETSDIHGYIANKGEKGYQYRCAYISDKIKDVRGYDDARRNELAILLDGGDIFQGTFMSNQFRGQSMSAAFAAMEYDAVTLGNHEFDWWVDTVVDEDGTMRDYDFLGLKGENTIPVIISNLYRNDKKVDYAGEYIILEKTAVNSAGEEKQVKVGVIGWAGDYGSSIMTEKFAEAGFEIRADYKALNELAAELEESGKCDATIVLAHHEATEVAEGLGSDTAVDIVLGGHTHKNIVGRTSWGLPYIEPDSYGMAYSYAELAFDEKDGELKFYDTLNTRCVALGEVTNRMLNTEENSEELDPAVSGITDVVIDEVENILSGEIGYITQSALRDTYIEGSKNRSCTMDNWMASMIMKMSNADIGFVNSGGIRTELTVDEADGKRVFTMDDLYQMFPFENNVYCYEITYEELLLALNYSLTPDGHGLLSRIEGIDCYFTDTTVNALVLPDQTTIYEGGSWRPGWRDKTVRVAMSQFIATTNRNAEGMDNPFCVWQDTDRLVDSSVIDFEGARAVLEEEARRNKGLITIDTAAHFISGTHDFMEGIAFVPGAESIYEGIVYNDSGDRYETVYTGQPIKPAITVTDTSGNVLTEGTDYKVSYSNNRLISTKSPAQIKITGIGEYSGSTLKQCFYIIPAQLSTAFEHGLLVMPEMITVQTGRIPAPVICYNGNRLTSKDYDISVEDSGTGEKTAVITGKGNFSAGGKDGILQIPVREADKKTIEDTTIRVRLKAIPHFYDGQPQELSCSDTDQNAELTVTAKTSQEPLKKDKDYSITYLFNTDAGKATAVINGIGDYCGTVVKTFTIRPAKSVGIDVKSSDTEEPVCFKPEGARPHITVRVTGATPLAGSTLTEGIDYQVKLGNNKKPGTGRYQVRFIGNYKGHAAVSGTFNIESAAFEADVEVFDVILTKSGSCISKPFVTIDGRLLRTGDYTVEYYEGEVTHENEEKAAKISSNTKVSFDATETVRYFTAVVTGRGNYAPDKVYATYAVIKPVDGMIDLSGARIVSETLRTIPNEGFTANPAEPKIRVFFKQDGEWNLLDPSYYDCTYINNVNRGRALILIRGDRTHTAGFRTSAFKIVNGKGLFGSGL